MADELMDRPAELLTADERAPGLDVFADRLRAAWVADLDSVPFEGQGSP
jgi:hypothetical protein